MMQRTRIGMWTRVKQDLAQSAAQAVAQLSTCAAAHGATRVAMRSARSVASAAGLAMVVGVVGVLAFAPVAGALAEQPATSQPGKAPPVPTDPVNVNDIQPTSTPPIEQVPVEGQAAPATPATAPNEGPTGPMSAEDAAPGETPAGQATAADAVKTGLGPRDRDVFTVSAFRMIWKFPDRAEQGDLQDAVNAAVAVLSVAEDGAYVAPQDGMPTVKVPVRDVGASGSSRFYLSGIDAIAQAVVDELNRRNLVGVVVEYDSEDVAPDAAAGEQDKRAGARNDLGLFVWTRQVTLVRSIALGERLESVEQKIDAEDSVHTRIRAQSPLQPGGLLTRSELDDYVFRLNRHPGRRVDVALAAGDEPGDVVLDYLVNEAKPWAVYAQISNTGTKSTGKLRERFGFTHNQLTGHDDILRLDYVTSAFDAANAINASYDIPLLSDKIRARFYSSYSEFTASDLGLADEEFSGETYLLGSEVTGTLWQQREWFFDLTGGMRYQNINVINEIAGIEGKSNFLIPYVGLNVSRFTDESSTAVGATIEYNISSRILGTDEEQIQNLGRQDVAQEWVLLKYQAEHSFYLDKLFGAQGMEGPEVVGSKNMRRWPTLAHEVSFSLRGQYAFGRRLIPQEEEVAGGFFSVRGYPESAAAGDSVLIASAEYRFHLPRIFPVSEPGNIGAREVGFKAQDFRWAPQQEFGRADWDLIFRTFIDVGQTTNSDPRVGENDETLVGAGIGAELQIKRNLNLRLDWGFALQEVGSEQQDDLVEVGSNEVHFSATILY